MILGSSSAAVPITNKNNISVAFGGATVSCELFTQTDGTFDDNNTTSQYGFGLRITSGNSAIGKTMISFTLDLKSSNTSTNAPLTFGVFASGNTSGSPDATFTGSINNNTGLTTSFVTYTFTGSRTLVQDDNICCFWGSPTGSGVIRQQLKNGGGGLANTAYVKSNTSSVWGSYGTSHIPNMTAKQC